MVMIMKEKKQISEENKKESIFYYEAIGFFFIFISIIIVAQLGKTGSLLTVFFKVLFGDWYLFIIFFIFVVGIYFILQHKSFDFRNQKIIGYMICSLGLLILAHFSVHKYVQNSSESYFRATWNHYKTFIQTKNDTYLGGGLVGGIIFYIVYSLLGSIGVYLISFFMFILGGTMMINKSIMEIVQFIYKKVKNAKKYTTSFRHFFKYELGKKREVNLSIYDSKKELPLKLLDDYKNYFHMDENEKKLHELKSLILSIFHHFSLEYQEQATTISYSCFVFTYYIFSSFECKQIGNKLNDLQENIVYLSRMNHQLQIEINAKEAMILSLKALLMKQSVLRNNYLLPIGISVDDEIIEVDFSKDGNFLMIGDKNSGMKTCLISMMVSMFFKVTPQECQFYLFDSSKDLSLYESLFLQIETSDIKEYISKIVYEIDERVSILSHFKMKCMDEYNMEQEMNHQKKMQRKIYVLHFDDHSMIHDDRFIEDKIIYILQVGKNAGIGIIVLSRNPHLLSTILCSSFKHKLIFHLKNGKDSKYLLNNHHACVLSSKGEAIYMKEMMQKRIQTAYISIEEVKRILK